jgi:hypothetical protein
MAGYWTAFARSGDPGPGWRRWQADSGQARMMVFDTAADGGVRMERHDQTVDALKAALARDPDFKGGPEEKGALYARMFGWPVFGTAEAPQALAAFARKQGYTGPLDALRPAHWP